MIREVDLVSYLPPFMADYREESATLEAENPEFRLFWEAIDRLYQNEFIMDADEYGITRFERLLKLHPYDTDTLEVRRLRVLTAWSKRTPYTLPWLKMWLDQLCGNEVHKEEIEDYTLSISLDRNNLDYTKGNGVVDILLNTLPGVLPANLYFRMIQELKIQGTLRAGGCFGTAVTLPVPTAVDAFDFQDALHAGAAGGLAAAISVPEAADAFDCQSGANIGGGFGSLAQLPVSESQEE